MRLNKNRAPKSYPRNPKIQWLTSSAWRCRATGFGAGSRDKTIYELNIQAKKLIDEANAIEQAEVNLKSTFAPKLSKALPSIKVARYLQIEDKIRAVVKYDLAQGVPLAK